VEALSEVASWAEADVEVELRGSLPQGWVFQFEFLEGMWKVAFEEGGRPIWEDVSTARNVALLSAYGWLWVHLHPKTKAGIWAPRPVGEPNRVPPFPSKAVSPDPADLDPDEIDAVYCGHHPRHDPTR